MRKIGFLGGSFNPIHVGHLMMAQAALDTLGLDEVVFVPAYCSPHKRDEDLASGQERLNMVRLAIAGNKRLSLSDVEIKRGGKSYTIETIRSFKNQYPRARLFFIIGEDNVAGLRTWQGIDEILCMASFIVINRSWFDVSSSLIRQHIKRKRSIRYLTPDAVVNYILRKKLYV
ncbi:MAG: nicotinate (nicotinamide) nucleotide adenylyltransferase [Candidatus Omnitrophica bacterium]|nr:nicotinate (nicotinamide) nucleotide adenylyltransferase [Candidatus Omnitrophota bacterium]